MMEKSTEDLHCAIGWPAPKDARGAEVAREVDRPHDGHRPATKVAGLNFHWRSGLDSHPVE
jgi:hypothetical protein